MNKKVITSTLVVAALALGYTGASWYTGNKIESRFADKVSDLTTKMNNIQGMDKVDVQYRDYQKGIFSTSFHLTVTIQDPNTLEELKTEDDITIYHGPFPFNLIKQGQFGPQMASTTYDMIPEKETELWDITNGKALFTIDASIDYSEKMAFDLTLHAIDYTDPDNGSTAQISKSTANLTADKNLQNINFKAEMANSHFMQNDDIVLMNNLQLSANSINDNQGYQIDLVIDDIEYKNSNENSVKLDKISIGNQIIIDNNSNVTKTGSTINIAKSTASLNDIALIINEFKVSGADVTDQNGIMSGDFGIMIKNIQYGQQDLGTGEVKLSYNGFSTALISTNSPFLVVDREQPQSEGYVHNRIGFNLDKLIWQNTAGELSASLITELQSEQDLLTKYQQNTLTEQDVSQLDVKLSLPFSVLSYLAAQLNYPLQETFTEETLDEMNMGITMMSGLFLSNVPYLEIVVDQPNRADGIYSDIYYSRATQEAHLNGQELAPGELFELLQ